LKINVYFFHEDSINGIKIKIALEVAQKVNNDAKESQVGEVLWI
jgi:hypothetical protein